MEYIYFFSKVASWKWTIPTNLVNKKKGLKQFLSFWVIIQIINQFTHLCYAFLFVAFYTLKQHLWILTPMEKIVTAGQQLTETTCYMRQSA